MFLKKENVQPFIPEVQSFQIKDGAKFAFTNASRIVLAKDGQALKALADIFASELQDATGFLPSVVLGEAANAGDLVLTNRQSGKKERYQIQIDTVANLVGDDKQGLVWATKTFLQLVTFYSPLAVPQCVVQDEPKFSSRGFMLDVGRKPFCLANLKEVIQRMSKVKLNDFHIHLNDNYIWLDDYKNPFEAYSGFRLESNIKGLTSEDRFYTKQEFRDLVAWAGEHGVHITAEIDVPAHSLAFTKVRPDLAVGKVGKDADHLDLNNPQSLALVKEVLSEYMDGGEQAVFAGCTVHIGTDEYSEKYAEEFRKFTDDLIRFVKDEKGYPVRLWGSLTARKGKTPVSSDGVEMNIWSNDWGKAGEMRELGFQLINTLDRDLYIVPRAKYYRNYLNTPKLYKEWVPHHFQKEQFDPADPQILGGAFALWNDLIDKRDNGLSEQEVLSRAYAAMPTLAQKLWDYAPTKTYRQFYKCQTKLFGAMRKK